MVLITQIHTLFIAPSFFPEVLFLSQIIIQDTTLYLVSSEAPLAVTSFSNFPCFVITWRWLRSLVFCRTSLSTGLSAVFLMIRLGLQIWGKKTPPKGHRWDEKCHFITSCPHLC